MSLELASHALLVKSSVIHNPHRIETSNNFNLEVLLKYVVSTLCSTRGSHTFSNEPNFFKNVKVVREKGSQCGVLAHEGGVTPLFDVARMDNEN